MQIKDLSKIGIVGPGLLGGSIAMGLKSGQIAARIIGVGHRQSSLDRGVEIGAIDEASLELSALADCQLVIIATPISLIKRTIDGLAGILPAGTVVTDVGSTKRKVCQWGKTLNRRKVEFVGSHPIAGSEKRGIDFARPDLFNNANCFVTPLPKTDPSAVRLVEELWTLLGMRVVRTDPTRHDELLAAVSHLPHVVAAGLVNACTDEQINFSGTGFIDTTRIASGDVGLWHDIVLSNTDKIQSALKKFTGQLDRFRKAVEAGDSKRICKFLERAKTRRDELMKFKLQNRQIEP